MGNYILLNLQPPLIIGDGAVQSVVSQNFQLLPAPEGYEAGITSVPSLMGLGAAIQYLEKINPVQLRDYEKHLVTHLLTQLKEVPHIKLYGDPIPDNRVGLLGFNIESINPHDLALILDETAGIQIRSGMLCSHPIVHSLSPEGMAQVSLHGYNSIEQIDFFIDRLKVIATELI